MDYSPWGRKESDETEQLNTTSDLPHSPSINKRQLVVLLGLVGLPWQSARAHPQVGQGQGYGSGVSFTPQRPPPEAESCQLT